MNRDDHLNAHYCEHESLTPNYSNENIVVPLNKVTKQRKTIFQWWIIIFKVPQMIQHKKLQ
jgi:hypothetical protein